MDQTVDYLPSSTGDKGIALAYLICNEKMISRDD